MNKSALVFGGSGFIGTHLLQHLKSIGYTNLISADIKSPENSVENVEYIICDVRKPIEIQGKFDEVYNFAAVHTTPGHEDHEYYDTNVLGALNVIEFCKKNDIQNICFTSSISVYGPGEDLKKETSEICPISAYGKSKYMAELIHKSWANDKPQKNQLIIVRPAVVYGPNENGNFTRLAKMLSKKLFFYPGRTDTIKACIYVGELIKTMEFAWHISKEKNQNIYLYNGAFNNPPTIKEICDAFHKVGHMPRAKLVVPLLFMKMASLPFVVLDKTRIWKNGICPERMDKLIKSTYVIPQKLLDDGYNFQYTIETSLSEWHKENAFDMS